MLIFCRLVKYVEIPAFKHNAITLCGYMISFRFTPSTYGPQSRMSDEEEANLHLFVSSVPKYIPFRVI